MGAVEITVNGTGVAGLAGPLDTAATVYLPDARRTSCPVVFAFPGDGYWRRYYDINIGGDSSYSQARHHIDRNMVLVASGQRDVVPDPHAEHAAYPSSPDVTLVVVPEMAHMHNFANTRVRLWDRLPTWIDTVVDQRRSTGLASP